MRTDERTPEHATRLGKALLWLLTGEMTYGLVLGVVCVLVMFLGGPVHKILEAAVVRVFQVTYLINAAGAVLSLLMFVRLPEPDSLSTGRLAPHLLNWVYVVSLSWVFGATLMAFPSGGFVD